MATQPTKSDVWAPARAHQTLAEYAFDALREAILTGELRPGKRLTINELTGAMDMSKMPIREALRRLESVGLVENTPYRGTRVTELSIQDLREVYQARLALEPLAVRCATEQFSDATARELRELLDNLNAYTDDNTPETWAAHKRFHYRFYEAAGSSWLIRLIQPLFETSERYRFATESWEPRSASSRLEHERILRAYVDQDPDRASFEQYNHLARTANAMGESMGSPGPLFALLTASPGT